MTDRIVINIWLALLTIAVVANTLVILGIQLGPLGKT